MLFILFFGQGDRAVLGQIGLTPHAKKVIELAADEARRLNHDDIGTEHLLLGLVREGESSVLESLGVNAGTGWWLIWEGERTPTGTERARVMKAACIVFFRIHLASQEPETR